jgi:hypothetical protein
VKPWIRVGAWVTGGTVATAVAAAGIGTLRWQQATARAIARLAPSAKAGDGDSLPSGDEPLVVPPPVARYFAFALTPGQAPVRRARLRFTGTFASKPGAWAPFTAEQLISARPPGFVWDARIAMAPLAAVRVRDSYIDGEGAMLGKVAGLVPVVDQYGTPEMAAGALHRFLGEAVWLPTALLPREGLAWSAIDATSARVTITDGPTTVSMDVRFGVNGEITTVSAMRFRDVNGTPVLTPWVGRHTDYARVDGMMIPTAGEVAWILPEGPVPYWRGRIIQATYER